MIQKLFLLAVSLGLLAASVALMANALFHAVRAAWAVAIAKGDMSVPIVAGPWCREVETRDQALAFARICIRRQWTRALQALVIAGMSGAALANIFS